MQGSREATFRSSSGRFRCVTQRAYALVNTIIDVDDAGSKALPAPLEAAIAGYSHTPAACNRTVRFDRSPELGDACFVLIRRYQDLGIDHEKEESEVAHVVYHGCASGED